MRRRTRARLFTVLLAGMLFSPAMATARTNQAPVMIGVFYERALNFVGGLEQAGITTALPFTVHWQPSSAFHATYFVQVAGGVFLNGSPDARPFLEAGPAITLQSAGGSWFLSAGIAPTLIGGSEFHDSRQLGGSFFFTTHLAVGWKIESWTVALRYQHTSNANFNNPNPGVNMLGLAFSTSL